MRRHRRILFRVDAGRATGLGHLMRCAALGEALRQRGFDCFFCTFDEEGLALRFLKRQHFAVMRVQLKRASATGKVNDLRQLVTFGKRKGSRAIVVDSYRIAPSYLESLKDEGWFVACLDDHAQRPVKADVIINGNLGAEKLRYRSPNHSRLLLGSRYALLRSEFQQLRETGGIVAVRPEVKRVLLCFGGSDSRGQTMRVLRLLETLPACFSIRVLVTSYFRQRRALQAAVRDSRRKIEVFCEPKNIGLLMRDCDLAITSAGVTSYELACLGVPFLVMKLYENQRFVYQRLIQEQIALSAGEGEASSDGFLLEQLERCLSSCSLRQKLQRNAVRRIDGRGAERVAEFLEKNLGAYFSVSSLRP